MAGEAILSEAATVARTPDEVLEDLVRHHSRLVYRIVDDPNSKRQFQLEVTVTKLR